MLTRMDDYLQQHPYMPEIKNPVLPTENFNRHWDQNRDTPTSGPESTPMREQPGKALDESSSEEAIKSWQDLFGEDFGKGSKGGGGGGRQSSGQSGSKMAGYVAPAGGIPVVRRPQEARRMG